MSKSEKKSAPLAIGIDVGGTGIKGAAIDLRSGALVSQRHKQTTPQGGSPEEILDAVMLVHTAIRKEIGTKRTQLPTGVCLPSVVKHGVTSTAANISERWIGLDAAHLFQSGLDMPVSVVNDADAAGYGEVAHGAAAGRRDTVLVTTLGTGIGSALVHDGHLFPNSELGHLELDGHVDYERFASTKVREREGLSYDAWVERLTPYYRKLEQLFAPDLFVVSGGISKKADEFLHLIAITTPIVPAKLRNNAGIVGTAMLAAEGWD